MNMNISDYQRLIGSRMHAFDW